MGNATKRRIDLDLLRELLHLAAPLALLWLGLSGGEDLLVGALAVATVALLGRRLAPMRSTRYSLVGVLRFVPYFLHRSLSGGFDVARRALHPRAVLDIHVVDHHFGLPPGQARTVFIALVSLLPGTLARSIAGDRLQVHSIAGDPTAELAVLERRVAALYAPEPTAEGAP